MPRLVEAYGSGQWRKMSGEAYIRMDDKVYKVVDDEFAEAHGAIRIIDETGEDYIYEAGRFVPVESPDSVTELFEAIHA